jgi:hypothetical protein
VSQTRKDSNQVTNSVLEVVKTKDDGTLDPVLESQTRPKPHHGKMVAGAALSAFRILR